MKFEKYDWSSFKSKPNSDRVSTVHDTFLENWIDSRQYIPLIFFFFPKLAWKYSNIFVTMDYSVTVILKSWVLLIFGIKM